MTRQVSVAQDTMLVDFARRAYESLQQEDPQLFELMEEEFLRQNDSLAMVASCSPTHLTVLACEGSFTSNVTAEGYPGARFHAGCKYVDQFEQLAIDRAKAAFKAQYANVQPHTASTANQIVTSSLLKPGDTLMGLQLDCGGHLSHGAKVNVSGRFFNAVGYGLNDDAVIDFDQVQRLAEEHRPKLIICGTTAYPRVIDWQRFRDIADSVDAYLLADITHISGLVIAEQHPNPIDVAHVTTTCTHKQLYGPRGGLILMGKEAELLGPDGKTTLSALFQKGVFPFMQGAPIVNNIVAKARALSRSMTPEFTQLAQRIVSIARALAKSLDQRGAHVISGGTDNHIVVVDVLSSFGVTGIVAEKALEQCNIIVNKNHIPGDQKSVRVTSGIRIGTNSLAARNFGPEEMSQCADLITRILSSVKIETDRKYQLEPSLQESFQHEVRNLCRQFPIPGYLGGEADHVE